MKRLYFKLCIFIISLFASSQVMAFIWKANIIALTTKTVSISTDGLVTDFYNGTAWTNYAMLNTAGTYEYGCYIDDSFSFTMFKLDVSDNSIVKQAYTLVNPVDNDDFHMSCSVGVDSDENIFATGFSHSGSGQETLVHYESTTPADITSLSTTDLIGSSSWETALITYPQYFRDSATDVLYLTARHGGSGNGDQYLLERDTVANEWDVPGGAGTDGIFIEGTTGSPTRSFYTLDVPYVHNSKIYFPGTFRSKYSDSTSPTNNHDVVMVVYDIDNNVFEEPDGTDDVAPIPWNDIVNASNTYLIADEGSGEGTDVAMSSQGGFCTQADGDFYFAYQANGDLIVRPYESGSPQTEIILDTPADMGGAWDGIRCFTDPGNDSNMAVIYVNRTEDERILHVFETSDNWDDTPIEYDIMERTNLQYSYLPWCPTCLYEGGYISMMVQPTDVNIVWSTCEGKCGVTPDSGPTVGGDGDNRVNLLQWAFGDQDAEIESTRYVGQFNGSTSESNHGSVMGHEGAVDLTVIALDWTPEAVVVNGGIIANWGATISERTMLMGMSSGASDELVMAVNRDGGKNRICTSTAANIANDTTYSNIAMRWDGGDPLDLDIIVNSSEIACSFSGSTNTASTIESGVTEDLLVGNGLDFMDQTIGDVFIFDEEFTNNKIDMVSDGAIYTYNLQHWFKFDDTTYDDQWGSADGTLTDVTIISNE